MRAPGDTPVPTVICSGSPGLLASVPLELAQGRIRSAPGL